MEQEAAHVLRNSGASIIFTSAKNYSLLKDLEDHLPELQAVVLLGGNTLMPLPTGRVDYRDYQEFMAEVQTAAISDEGYYDSYTPKEDDLASLIYTSGTTGRQKGAMLTHGNFTSNVNSCLRAINIGLEDNVLLVLPLHHAFAFTTNLLLPLASMCEISLVQSLKTIRENMYEVKPTILIAVPLLLEKMYAKIQAGLRKKKIAYGMTKIGLSKIVGKGLVAKLGGALRLIVSGGAPCDPEILRGWGKLGMTVVEGYGLTETSPVLTLNPVDDPRPGTVGPPLPDVEISILDADERGVGEIAVKGPNVMRGYYENPEATAESFQDGWLLTGDLGFIDADGYVTISGRKKNLIVNREGKNIYPEEVEQQICKSPYILECVALGYRPEGQQVGERVGLIVVPDQEAMDNYAAKRGISMSDVDVDTLVRSEVRRLSRDISGYKRPRRIQIRVEEFEKTSTAKIKRYLHAMDVTQIEE